MEEFIIMLRNVLMFVALAIPGYILVKGKLLKPEQSGVLSKLLMYLALPFMIFSGVVEKLTFNKETLLTLGVVALIGIAVVLFMFFIPVKMKWLALVDAAFFAIGIIQSLMWGYVAGWVTPLIAVANFLVFFWNDLMGSVERRRGFVRHQNSHQTIQFKKAAEAQQRKDRQQGYRHKCSVCGRTDASHPDLQFRYCSRCAGYHCFCEEHIFNHVHFTEE